MLLTPASEDIGNCAYGIFRRGAEIAGRRIGIAGEIPSGPEMAEAFSRALGPRVGFSEVPFDVYRGLGFPGADDLGNMFKFQALFNDEFCNSRDVALSRSLAPELQNFETWLKRNASKMPLG